MTAEVGRCANDRHKKYKIVVDKIGNTCCSLNSRCRWLKNKLSYPTRLF